MRRRQISCLIIVLIGISVLLTGCVQMIYGLSEGTYAQPGATGQGIKPHISFDLNKYRFSFAYDPLSSDVAVGTVKLNGRIVATTDDGKLKYIFEVIDNDIIRFKQNGSLQSSRRKAL